MSDVLGYRIVAVKACLRGKCLTYDDEAESFHDANDYWDVETRCEGCNRDGTRTVDTGITVERTTVEVGVYDLAVWREVPE